MKVRSVFLFSDTWEQVNGVASLYRAVFRHVAAKRGDHEEIRLIWIYPTSAPSVKTDGSVTLVGLRPSFYCPVPRCPELRTGALALRDIASIADCFGPPDVVHVATQGPFGLAGRRFATTRGIGCSAFYHTNWPAYSEAHLASTVCRSRSWRNACATLASLLEHWFFAHCDVLFCHTPASALQFSRRGCPQIVLVSQFLDTARFPIRGPNKPQPAESDVLSLVYVGRLALEKSVDSILRYSRTPGLTVHVVGDGPLRPKLMRKYPTALYHGNLEAMALRGVIDKCDYLVLPSRTETLGLVVLEAAACGVPSILLRGEVPSEIVGQYSAGVIVDSFDGPGWVERAKVVRASNRYDTLVSGCRDMAISQSVEFGAERLIDTWRSLASRN